MIFNNASELKENLNYNQFKLNENLIKNIATVFIKIDNNESLHEMINAIIDYFYDKKILLIEIHKNRLRTFTNYKNSMTRNLINHKLLVPVAIKVPNVLYYKLPIIDKLEFTNQKKHDLIKWDKSKLDKYYDLSMDINSRLYTDVVKDITGNKGKIYELENLVLYDLKYASSNKELKELIDSLVFPSNCIDIIVDYIDNLIDYFKELEYKPINEMGNTYEQALRNAVKFINMKKTYHLNIINFLLRIYTVKQEIILNGVEEKNLEINMVTEMFNFDNCLNEYFEIKDYGICNKTYDKLNEIHNGYLDAMVYYVNKNIDTIFTKCMKEIDLKCNDNLISLTDNNYDDNTIDFILSNNFNKDITKISLKKCNNMTKNFDFNRNKYIEKNKEEIKHKIKNLYKSLKETINSKDEFKLYENKSFLYDRTFDNINLFMNEELNFLKMNLEDDINLNEETYKFKLNNVKDKNTLERYYNTIPNKYCNSLIEQKVLSKFDSSFITTLQEFLYKCNLISA